MSSSVKSGLAAFTVAILVLSLYTVSSLHMHIPGHIETARDHSKRASYRYYAGDLDGALVEARLALKLAPHDYRPNFDLGWMLTEKGRYSEAETIDRNLLTMHPNDAGAYSNLGYTLFKAGRYDEAESEVRQALSLNPDCYTAHDCLGQIMSHTGRAKEAVDECGTAFRLRHLARYVNNESYALLQLGRIREAREGWNLVLMSNTDVWADAEAKYMLAQYPE